MDSDRTNPQILAGDLTMTKLFASPVGCTLANDAADARAICVEAGRIQCECDLSDQLLQDVTEHAFKGMPPMFQETLKALMDHNMRGLAYPDPKGWVCVPLSKDCPTLHPAVQNLVPCPACGAEKGEPCNGDSSPIMEGTCHRRRVRYAIVTHPELLHAPVAPAVDTTAKPWLHHDATELVDCQHCHAPAGFPCDGTPEGKAHPERIASLIAQLPECLDHPICKPE